MPLLDPETAALLRGSAAGYAARHRDFAALRLRRKAGAAEELAGLADQGWLAAFLPEEAGGMGLGLEAGALLAEALSPALLAAPLAPHFLACRLLMLLGAAPAQFDGMAEGEHRLVVAFQEGPDDLFAHECANARLDAAGRLHGRKRFIGGAAEATGYLVTAKGPQGLSLLRLEAGAPGCHLRLTARADGSSVGELELAGAPARLLCDDPGRLVAALSQASDEASLIVAAELMGQIGAMMEMTLEHLRNRQQFGQPIGAFQALQHRAADLFVQQLLSRSVLDAAIARLAGAPEESAAEAGGMAGASVAPAERLRIVSRARARLNATARMMAREAIQLFGAMGITEENDLSLHVKRVLALAPWLGTEHQHRSRYARALGLDLAAQSKEETGR